MVFARRNFQDKLDMINTFRRKEGTKHIFENKETFSNYIQNQVGKDRLQVNKMMDKSRSHLNEAARSGRFPKSRSQMSASRSRVVPRYTTRYFIHRILIIRTDFL